MAETELKTNTPTEVEEGNALKGTLASVFFIGFVIVATWAGVYFLYLDRF